MRRRRGVVGGNLYTDKVQENVELSLIAEILEFTLSKQSMNNPFEALGIF
jgi:hypothetical protein